MGKKKASKKSRLRVQLVVDAPLQEVSGICVRRDTGGALSLIAVGDRAAVLIWAHLSASNAASPDWQNVDMTTIAGSSLSHDDPQLEAVCADGDGRILLLQESPPRAELVDLDAARVVATIDLVVEGDDKLARSWSKPDGSRGEGAVLLPGGHLLIAKEKHPAALIEFGPEGARSVGLARGEVLESGAKWPVSTGHHRFVPLAVWWPDEPLSDACDDFSDLEIGPDGALYVLSDKSSSIARIRDLEPGGGTASLEASWELEVEDKPEGLAFTPGGSAIVALDKRKRRNNLVLLEPPIARPGTAVEDE